MLRRKAFIIPTWRDPGPVRHALASGLEGGTSWLVARRMVATHSIWPLGNRFIGGNLSAASPTVETEHQLNPQRWH
jgi:hypothetical protein